MSVCLVGALAAPLSADTIPLLPSRGPVVIGLDGAATLELTGGTAVAITDLAGSFVALPILGGNDLGAPDMPVDGAITIGLGGTGGATATGGTDDSLIPGGGLAGGHVPAVKGDPAGVTIPLPGPALMGMAGLAGVMAISARRRR